MYSVTFATMFLEAFSLHILKKRFQGFSNKSEIESSGDFLLFYYIFLNCVFTNGFFPILPFPHSLFYTLFC